MIPLLCFFKKIFVEREGGGGGGERERERDSVCVCVCVCVHKVSVCVHKLSGLFFKCQSDLKLRSLSKITKSGLNSVKMLTHHQF